MSALDAKNRRHLARFVSSASQESFELLNEEVSPLKGVLMSKFPSLDRFYNIVLAFCSEERIGCQLALQSKLWVDALKYIGMLIKVLSREDVDLSTLLTSNRAR